jgi:hypothetical protein
VDFVLQVTVGVHLMLGKTNTGILFANGLIHRWMCRAFRAD